MASDLNVGVLETGWDKKRGDSIRFFFGLLSYLYLDAIDGFVYERFASRKALLGSWQV